MCLDSLRTLFSDKPFGGLNFYESGLNPRTYSQVFSLAMKRCSRFGSFSRNLLDSKHKQSSHLRIVCLCLKPCNLIPSRLQDSLLEKPSYERILLLDVRIVKRALFDRLLELYEHQPTSIVKEHSQVSGTFSFMLLVLASCSFNRSAQVV